jgi:hypothetical protein
MVLCTRCLAGTKNLRSVTFESSSELDTIMCDVFWCSSIERLELPPQLKTFAPANFFNCHCLVTIDVKNTDFEFEGGLLLDLRANAAIFGIRSISFADIPSKIEIIGASRFRGRVQIEIDWRSGILSNGSCWTGNTGQCQTDRCECFCVLHTSLIVLLQSFLSAFVNRCSSISGHSD